MNQDPWIVAEDAAGILRIVGSSVNGGLGSIEGVATKSTDDVVTDADLTAAEQVRSLFGERFPAVPIWTEEDASAPPQGMDDARGWFVDPIDGSNNIAIGLPLFGSIGYLTGIDQLPDIAIAVSPVRNSFVLAVEGQGLRLRAGTRRRGLRPTELRDSVLSWVQGYGLKGSPLTENLWHDLRMRSRRVISTWSPSVDLNLLAECKYFSIL